MELQPDKRNRKFHMGKGRRLQIYTWCILVGIVLLIGAGVTFAWYSLQERDAETKVAPISKPYYLSLRNASDTAGLQLSIGSLPSGKVRQIVFCVSSEDDTISMNTDIASFPYALELIHTDNLPLVYRIYPLANAEESEAEVTITEDGATYGELTLTHTTYWKKSGAALAYTDVSEKRRVEAGLGENTDGIINRGTYLYYGKTDTVDNNLELVPAEGEDYACQYFLMEIAWGTSTNIGSYDKETDMIYLAAKALQPEPEKSAD